MASKEQKNYTFIIKDGRANLTMKTKGQDGRFHSASCEYPRIIAKGQKKMTRKQVEEHLLKIVLGA